MTRYHVQVLVSPRPGLLDPQGAAIQHALQALGFHEVQGVRAGKALDLDLEASSPEDARSRAGEMARKLLSNPVTEDFRIEVEEAVEPESQSPVGAEPSGS